jgi:hypothetical protein
MEPIQSFLLYDYLLHFGVIVLTYQFRSGTSTGIPHPTIGQQHKAAGRCLAEERNCKLSPVKNWLYHSMRLLSSAHHHSSTSTSTSNAVAGSDPCAFFSGWPGQKDTLVISAITFVCLIRSLNTWVVWATKVWWIIIEWASQLIILRVDRFHAFFCQMFGTCHMNRSLWIHQWWSNWEELMDSSQRKHENNPTELCIAGSTLLSVYLDSGVQVARTLYC